jgi:hypothetical protein
MPIVYTHTRLDNNKVFYVGIGGSKNRAYCKRNRNKHWYHVVNKHGYKVNVTHEDICYEEALSIEKYLISFYGRLDLKEGTLVNMTDGGEGTINVSKEATEKRMNTCKSNGVYEDMCERMRRYGSAQDKSGVNSSVRIGVYVYDEYGNYKYYAPTLTQFCNSNNTYISFASRRLDNGMPIKKHYLFSSDMGPVLKSDQFITNVMSNRSKLSAKKNKVSVLNLVDNEIYRFDSFNDASIHFGKNRTFVSKRVREGRLCFDNYKIILN